MFRCELTRLDVVHMLDPEGYMVLTYLWLLPAMHNQLVTPRHLPNGRLRLFPSMLCAGKPVHILLEATHACEVLSTSWC